MWHTKIKICGITTLEDALFAIACGADALGFVFYPQSPRFITLEAAAKIIEKLPPFVTICGLFVNATASEVNKAISTRISLLQFHGNETPDFCQQFDFPYIRAIQAQNEQILALAQKHYSQARALLVDSYDPKLYGGSGQGFDWLMIPNELRHKIILAGGLNPANVCKAIEQIQPFAVDVSSGVESQKGIKSHSKIKAFCTAVHTTYN